MGWSLPISVAAASDEVFEAAQQCGEAGAAAESDDVQTSLNCFDLRRVFSR